MSDRRFGTLRDLGGDSDHDSGGDSSGESGDERRGRRQGFFVGGSEHSGQQVLGPRGPAPDGLGGVPQAANNVFDFDALMRSAREHGAEVVNPGQQQGVSLGGGAIGGARLGRGGEVADAPGQGLEPIDQDVQPEEVDVRLTLWTNGFSVDDGPLRQLDDPASLQFLDAIKQGRIPPELVMKHRGKLINMRMERRSTPYQPPKAKAFAGHGQRLGGVVPVVIGAGASSSGVQTAPAVAQPAQPNEEEKLLKEAQAAVGVSDDKEKTNVQIRLPDGSRLVATFNADHTITALRSFVVSARPDMAFVEFQLMTTFPNKVISDEAQTLKSAGLINAVVMVKQVIA